MSRALWRDHVDKSWTGSWTLPAPLERPLAPDERAAMVALACSAVGPARTARALDAGERPTELLARTAGAPAPDEAAERLKAMGARAVIAGDGEYPESLLSVASPPLVLFVRGKRLDELAPGVAVVGSRVCTPGGARFATAIGESLARTGFTVVSGLARGIDAAAHLGALMAGASIAVLGTGIDVVYPAEHDRLAAALAQDGALVTEFAPGVGPRPWHFPSRNRIIAGLVTSLVVVEARLGSGALITASFALDHGREVYACTVSPYGPSGAGVRELLREGARLLVDAEQLIEDLCGFAGGRERPARATPEGDDGAVLAAVLEDTSVDEIVERTGLPAGKVSAALTMLQLEGLVADDGGGRWRRI